MQARITCGKVELLLLVVKWNCLWHFVEFDNVATNAHDTAYYHFYPELFANKLKIDIFLKFCQRMDVQPASDKMAAETIWHFVGTEIGSPKDRSLANLRAFSLKC